MEQVPGGWIPSTEYWYGPHRRWTWATDRARQEQADPTPLPKFLEEPVKVATTDPTGVKQTAMKIRGGILYVTPEPYKDDVSAFLYYGTIGLMDPKNPADAAGYSKLFGWSYSTGLGVALIGGFFFWGILGWSIDWSDKREGGLAETEWWNKWMNPDNYSLPEGW